MRCYLEILAANNTRRIRKERKWSQHDLEDKAGIPYNSVGDLERLIGNFNLQRFEDICKAFEIRPSDLLEEVND